MFFAAATPPRLSTLVFFTGLAVLSLNMFLPSLANVSATFEADYALVSLSIAGYLAMTALLQLVIGPLSDRFGRRPVLLAGFALFTLASLGCLLAGDIWTFLVFRMLQGAVISGSVLSSAVVRDMVPAREAASLIGYISMAMAVAPMIGPMIGGVLDEFFGWRANFIVYCGLGVLATALCWIDLGETNRNRSETLSSQLETYPELFQSRRFWGYSLCMAFSTGAFYAFLAGSPLVTTVMFDMSTGTLGFYMGTITAGFFLGSFLSGRYSKRYPLIAPVIAGRIIACTGLTAGLILFMAGIVHELSLFGATIFVGLGNGLTMPGCNAGAMSVRPALAGSAAGLAGALTVAGGAVLTSITGAAITAESGAYMLLGLMLLSSFLGLLAALYVREIDRHEGLPGT